jgi:nucleotide-binding universal stress UspA family protein
MKAPVFRRILFATDFSPASEKALQAARLLARKFGASLRVVHVVDNAPVLSYYTAVYQARALEGTRRQQARKALDKLMSRQLAKGARARAEVRVGNPAEQILKAARGWRAQLIVLGTHGFGPLARTLLGSTADKVVRRSSVPVLTVRGGA